MAQRKITLGGKDFSLRPLTLRQLRVHERDIEIGCRCGPKATVEEQDAYCRILAAGLTGNDPAPSADELLDLVDLGDIGPVWAALLGMSGYVERKPGEA